MGKVLSVVGNKSTKIHTISVEEILKFNNQQFLEEQSKVDALKELRAFIKEICSKNAYKMRDLTTMIRGFTSPPISENLKNYIVSTTNRKIKRVIDNIIVKQHADDYTSFEANPEWEVIKKRSGIFKRNFYYFNEENFVNVYTIPESQLPLYMNHDWSDKNDKEHYMYRMRNISGKGL